jgi:ubiquinone biosynthesis protein COQ9
MYGYLSRTYFFACSFLENSSSKKDSAVCDKYDHASKREPTRRILACSIAYMDQDLSTRLPRGRNFITTYLQPEVEISRLVHKQRATSHIETCKRGTFN